MARASFGAVVAVAAFVAASAAGAASAPAAPRPASGGGTEAVATIEVGGSPSSIVAAARSVWVSLGLGGVARIDPEANEVVARIRPGGALIDLAAGFGALWAVDVFGDRLLRIDPRTNRVTRTTRVNAMPSGVVAGRGLVWVTSQLDSTVSGVDPTTGRVVKIVQFSYGELWPGGLAVTHDGVWVITGAGNELTLVDPTRMAVTRRIPVTGARALAVTGRALWVGLAREAWLLRVAADGGVLRLATAGYRTDGYGPALAGGRRLSLAAAGRVALVDPVGGAVRPVLRMPGTRRAAAIAVAGGDVWVADAPLAAVLRVPSRRQAPATASQLDLRASPPPTRTASHVSPRGGRAAGHDHRR